MAVNLQKGQTFDLTKGVTGLCKLVVGLGWDINRHSGSRFFTCSMLVVSLRENHPLPIFQRVTISLSLWLLWPLCSWC